MELTVTAKLKLLPTTEDRLALLSAMNAYREACNFVSDYCFATHELRFYSLHKALYGKLRSQYGLKAQMAQSVIKTVVARYSTVLKNQKQWIKPFFGKPQLDLVWNRDYSLTKERFSVNTLSGRKKLSFCEKGMEQYFDPSIWRFGTAKLVYRHGMFFLHIPVTKTVPEPEVSSSSVICGVDRGVNFLAATFDSYGKSSFVSGRLVKQKRAHFKKVRQSLQKVGTPSSRHRLKSIGQRENRYMQDVNHCVSKALVSRYPEDTLFVLEDLSNVRKATERVRIKDRYVSVSWAFYDLEQKLVYKATMRKQSVLKVDPAYTSQRCPVCGHTEKGNRDKRMHAFGCKKCGYRSNDDRIGAMNLYRMGKDSLSKLSVPDTDPLTESAS